MDYYFSEITNAGFLYAVKKFPLLEDLELSHCYIEGLDLKVVGLSCPNLKTLKLNRKGWKLPRLEFDDDALAIAETMPKLRHLQLCGNRLTDFGLNAILDNCLHLDHLDLRQCFNIDLVGDLEKRCFKSIKDVRLTYDSAAGYPINFDGIVD
ncbi:unnamed protein product [Arabis nemorensis]|uniref:Uncharacterized protein n=1 Tax=Arabis nemorensis TaxID=586526 RepID=A0A565C2P1_9BRAS|nr:unnamed protein product [Arabis nemorensis]